MVKTHRGELEDLASNPKLCHRNFSQKEWCDPEIERFIKLFHLRKTIICPLGIHNQCLYPCDRKVSGGP